MKINLFSFTKKDRLLNPKDYSFVFEKPHRVGNGNLTILFRDNKKEHSRLGLIIAKKNVKKAVERNRVKRLIRESFRYHKTKLQGLDIIVIAKRGINSFKNNEILQNLDVQWNKIQHHYQK